MAVQTPQLAVIFIIGILTIGLNTSCALAKRLRKKDFKENASERYVIHGDPLELLKGATLSRVPVLTTADLRNPVMKSWDATITAFTEKAKLLPDRSHEEIKEENSTAEDSSDADGSSLVFKLMSCDLAEDCDAKLLAKRGEKSLEMSFEADSLGSLMLKGVGTETGVAQDVDVLHYSINPERDHFSILFAMTDEDGKTLIAVDLNRRFSMLGLPSVSKVSTEYDYLMGEGVRLYWPGDLSLTLCDPDSDDRVKLERYARDWETASGKIDDMRFEIIRAENFPPFSDVNTRCLLIADTYVVNDRDNEVVLGRTHFSMVDATSQLNGASVVIFEKSHVQVCDPECGDTGYYTEDLLAGTIRHEVGHALGLGHEFSKDSFGRTKHPSVMGYDNQLTITAFDREALRELNRDRSLVKVQNGIMSACRSARLNPDKPSMVKFFGSYGAPDWANQNDKCEDNVSLAFTEPTVLKIDRYKVDTLEGVHHFDFVKTIEIRDGAISDLSPLGQLSSLEQISVYVNAEKYIKVCPTASTPVLNKYCTALKTRLGL